MHITGPEKVTSLSNISNLAAIKSQTIGAHILMVKTGKFRQSRNCINCKLLCSFHISSSACSFWHLLLASLQASGHNDHLSSINLSQNHPTKNVLEKIVSQSDCSIVQHEAPCWEIR